ncbi:MAG: hypothetical protein P8Z70_09155, partial [Desulfuromonadales bacterium]
LKFRNQLPRSWEFLRKKLHKMNLKKDENQGKRPPAGSWGFKGVLMDPCPLEIYLCRLCRDFLLVMNLWLDVVGCSVRKGGVGPNSCAGYQGAGNEEPRLGLRKPYEFG